MGYPIQLKETVLKKILLRNKIHFEVASDFGVGRSTIGKWLREYKQNGSINLNSKEKRPRDWTAEERISAIIVAGTMTGEEKAAWCRRSGIFTQHLY